MSSYQYRKSHCGDKTILWPSYLHNGISYTGKMTSLYWIRALVATFSHVGGSFYRHHSRAFEWSHLFNLGLGAACWAHFICQHELWPSLSFLNSSWGIGGGKHYRKLSTEGGCGRHFENGVLEPYGWDSLQTCLSKISSIFLRPSAKTCIFRWWDSIITERALLSVFYWYRKCIVITKNSVLIYIDLKSWKQEPIGI